MKAKKSEKVNGSGDPVPFSSALSEKKAELAAKIELLQKRIVDRKAKLESINSLLADSFLEVKRLEMELAVLAGNNQALHWLSEDGQE